jgi:hypothetical protein
VKKILTLTLEKYQGHAGTMLHFMSRDLILDYDSSPEPGLESDGIVVNSSPKTRRFG